MPTSTIIRRFVKDESAATAVEYGIIAAIMGLGVVAGVDGIGDLLQDIFDFVLNALTSL